MRTSLFLPLLLLSLQLCPACGGTPQSTGPQDYIPPYRLINAVDICEPNALQTPQSVPLKTPSGKAIGWMTPSYGNGHYGEGGVRLIFTEKPYACPSTTLEVAYGANVVTITSKPDQNANCDCKEARGIQLLRATIGFHTISLQVSSDVNTPPQEVARADITHPGSQETPYKVETLISGTYAAPDSRSFSAPPKRIVISAYNMTRASTIGRKPPPFLQRDLLLPQEGKLPSRFQLLGIPTVDFRSNQTREHCRIEAKAYGKDLHTLVGETYPQIINCTLPSHQVELSFRRPPP